MSNPPQPPPPPLEHFLKIPRIRLNKKQQKLQLQQQDNNSSSHSANNKGHLYNHAFQNNNKFIETGHLVNTNVLGNNMIHNNSGSDNNPNSGSGGGGDHHHHNNQDEIKRFIKPKKLPNPIKESQAMQNLHKELLLNQKIGRSVLTHKTELQKAIEKLAAKQQHGEIPDDIAGVPPPLPPPVAPSGGGGSVGGKNKQSEFQRVLEARAKLIEDQKCFVDGESKQNVPTESEFEKIHKRVTKQK